ncbi:GntR family transcriptional regulator [Carboxydochorda subterranea]|uniref:GntR family transcriptional regulator n=1 Tax=Carboxydichorda subterranea TaxID=3109565 RepID=A0ABZ1C1J0_9FIRM|nr:GntR family transcriptional regulator [Limnochorda sp. L945t]WRP18187.1 GntR family transcriptional regulator [Limnochorda sp. L945t]
MEPVVRGAALPLYHQLHQALRRRITEGEWKPGFRLPGERELMRLFGVSRTTVRQALDALEADGLIERRHGQGTFVASQPVLAHLAVLRGFTEELREQGLPFEVRVLQAGCVPAPPEAARALGIEPGEEVVQISRVVWLGGEPLFTDDSFLLPAQGRLVASAEPDLTIYSALESIGYPVASGEQTVEAAPAGAAEADRLRVRRGRPVLLIRRVARLVDGTPVEFRRVAYRGDRYRYRITLVRTARTERGSVPRG